MIAIKTFQDLQAVGADEQKRMEFVLEAIGDHKSSELYKTGKTAEDYYRGLNTTIMTLEKVIYNAAGKAVPDIYSPNHKIPCRYFFYFVTQRVQYLLGNGVSFAKPETKSKLGKKFDKKTAEVAVKAVNSGAAYGFWNLDHLEPLGVAKAERSNEPVFIPLEDEETGELKAGIRFWKIAENKPLRCTLFEVDGMTEYIERDGKMQVYTEKHDYKRVKSTSRATGTTVSNGGNYGERLPIIPMFNVNRQSELLGRQFTVDAYDLMISKLVNNVDNAELIYWVLKNCGGMDEIDDELFIEQLKMTHVVHVDGENGGADVEAHKVEAPFDANETALARLRNQLFDDFMALDTKNIAGGAATATQIEAAYEPLNSITDLFEGEVTDFILSLLELIGIDDAPTYTRSLIVNQQEMIQNILQAAEYLSEDYITKKILEILGDTDKVDEVMNQRLNEEAGRYTTDETK